jgi:hypothetical protein
MLAPYLVVAKERRLSFQERGTTLSVVLQIPAADSQQARQTPASLVVNFAATLLRAPPAAEFWLCTDE